MRCGFVGADGEHRIQQQHPLFGPAVEVAAARDGRPRIVAHLLENILQRRRKSYAVPHRETEPVGLSLAVVGILSDDDDLELVEGAFVESAEDILPARENAARGVLLPDESGQGGKVGLLELRRENIFPVGSDLHIHSGMG